jgi:neutral ceramidase
MKKKLSVVFITILVLAVTSGGCSQKATKKAESETSQLMVGAAVRDITPSTQMFPLFRGRNEFGGLLDSLHVRAIAISNGGTPSLIICPEIIGNPLPVVEAVAKHTGLPLEAIFSTATHCHTAPTFAAISDSVLKSGSKLTNEQVWGKYLLEQTLAAVDEALANMKPATVGIGYSESYIKVNRLSHYNQIAKDGTVSDTLDFGFNPTGPSDKTLATIRFNDLNGKPIAFIVNYGTHAIVMHNNTIFAGKLGMSADIPGKVSGYLEEKYNGSVAMWLKGAAGDQQTIIQNMMFTRNPMTGEQETKNSDSYDIMIYLAKLHFADIETALSKIKDYSGNVKVNYDFVKSSIPALAGGDYPLTLQLLRIGDIALVGFSGDLFTPVSVAMKQNSLLKNTIIVTHAYQRSYQSTTYHADDESIARGGYGTNAKFKPGYLTKELTSMMNGLIEKTNN